MDLVDLSTTWNLGVARMENAQKGSQSLSTHVLLSTTEVFLTTEGEVQKREVTYAKKIVRTLNSKVTVDNRWVVPYSPYLLKKFKCHINVEYCASITAIKYLFLYHFKGEDMVTQELDFSDEVRIFQTRKFISACYAHWRIMEFDMVQCKPAVHQLPVHLHEEQ